MQKKASQEARLSGQVIIDQLIKNMELGRFEMAYSVLVPCIFSIYLNPEDYARLATILDFIREDAKRALSARLGEWNAKPFTLTVKRGNKQQKEFKTACKDWVLDFFPDNERSVPVGDVEIHSELNETPQPGYHGVKTTLMDREPSVNEPGRHDLTRGSYQEIRTGPTRPLAELRYEDESGPQVYLMDQEQISVGRGGDDLSVSLALYTNDEVSREHLRLRWDPGRKGFLILDVSRNGTWLNGRRIPKGVEQELPDRAEIGLAEVLTLNFEVKR